MSLDRKFSSAGKNLAPLRCSNADANLHSGILSTHMWHKRLEQRISGASAILTFAKSSRRLHELKG